MAELARLFGLERFPDASQQAARRPVRYPVGDERRRRGPDDLDDDRRASIRRSVLGTVQPRTASLSDRAYAALSLFALPAPHLVRTLVSLALVAAVVATATVASADALPSDPLYGVKVASEEVRLALAYAPEDRAAVELSMADHRLAEAERLALAGREDDAVVATSTYGTHLANAAAELARVERLEPTSGPVVDQLRSRLADQQRRAADLAVRLADDPATAVAAPLFSTVASLAPVATGPGVAEGIALHAAAVAEHLAEDAERAAQEAEDEEADHAGAQAAPARPRVTPAAPRSAPVRTPEPRRGGPPGPAISTPPAVGNVTGPFTAGRVEPTRAAASATPTHRPTAPPTRAARDARAAREAAERAKGEAEKARHAAEKAREAGKRTASPRPSPRR